MKEPERADEVITLEFTFWANSKQWHTDLMAPPILGVRIEAQGILENSFVYLYQRLSTNFILNDSHFSLH